MTAQKLISGLSRPALTYFPPVSNTYHRLRNALAESFPELLETLNPPVDQSLLSTFESQLGCPLPPPVRESFLIADGQDIETGVGGLFFGLHLLPLEDVIREWTFWRQVENDPSSGSNAAVLATMSSVPPQWIKNLYACKGWIPLISDRTGNYVGVDLDPGPGGNWGQVIVFGRDFDRKCVLWKGEGEGGWGRWLSSFVDELESGEGWEADKANSSDEDEEVGYGDYSGGGSYGESGKGLRLAGEYRGWNVLEAWWDRSVRNWEEMGMGLDVEEIERGLQEARRLTGYEEKVAGKGKGKAVDGAHGLGIGMRTGESAAQVEIPGTLAEESLFPSNGWT
jgi:cell wall assembly regulator SMI1